MEELISTFHIDWKVLIAQMVNFGLVFAVLYWFALRPLSKLMEERSKKIADGLEQAEKNQEILKQAEEEYKKSVQTARQEAQEILRTTKQEAEAKRAELLEEAKSEVESLLKNGQAQLEQEKKAVLESIQGEVSSLVTAATAKILSGVVDEKVDDDIIRQQLAKLK